MIRWYLIHTKPAGESIAQVNLERQGYEVYLPRLARPVRRRAGWIQTVVPLFPRYVFLGLEDGCQALGPVRSTVGVANVVRFGPSVAVVPQEVIDDLRLREDPASGLSSLSTATRFAPGSRVRIAEGAFSGLEAIFEREAGGDRVVVLLELLGQNASVRVPAGFVVQSLAFS